MRVRPSGSRGVLLEVDDLTAVLRLHERLRAADLRGVVDLVPAARTVLVVLDPARTDPATVARAVTDLLRASDGVDLPPPDGRAPGPSGAPADGLLVGGHRPVPEQPVVEVPVVVVPVVYDGEDLDRVGGMTGWGAAGVVERHTATTWTVAFGGFAPGFAYAVADDGPQWQVPRRPEPRTRVPAGSVALADGFTGVYPSASPGGWQLIGRTTAPVWDLHRDPPALLRPGVRARFVAVDP